MIEQWYTRYSGELAGFIRSKGFTPEDAEDICAQVFLEAVVRQPADIAPRAWLYRVAQSRMIDRHRQAQRRPTAPLEEWSAYVDLPELEDHTIRTALLLLTPAQQRVIEARFLQDRTLDEVAAELGMGVGAVKALQHRGVAALQTPRIVAPHYSLPHERAWTHTEVERLRLGVDQGWDYPTIGRWLGRSTEAIRIKACRIGHTPHSLHPTASVVARALGVKCAKTVQRWVKLGWLPASRSSQQAHAHWYIRWADVWAFLENEAYWMAWHPERIADPARRTWALELRKGQPQWLTPGQVAKRYHVFGNVVNAWISAFGLKATRYGNWWINERDLVDWVPPGELPRAPRKRGVRHKRPRLPAEARQIVRGPHSPPPVPRRKHSQAPAHFTRYPADQPPAWAHEDE